MSYIVPNSDVKLLQNVPLSKDYENTILFDTVANQTAYFTAKAAYTFSGVSFLRQQPGTMMLAIAAETAMLCNYVMFKNTSYGNKWFYAFIDGVDYINDSTSLIRFTLDVLQTWHFNYVLEDMFLDRNHTKVDAVGTNITPENVALGEYIFNDYDELKADTTGVDLNKFVIIAVASDTLSTSENIGSLINGVYAGVEMRAFNVTNYVGVNAFIDSWVSNGLPSTIFSMYMCPRYCFDYDAVGSTTIEDALNGAGLKMNQQNTTGYPTGLSNEYDCTFATITSTTDLNGYVPKNKKMYTYPYHYLHVDNGSGQETKYCYEFFKDKTPVLTIGASILMPIVATVRPKNYKITNENTLRKTNMEMATLSGFPMCAWNVDMYAAWCAQNSLPMQLQTGMGIAGSIIQAAVNPIGAGMNIFSTVSNSLMRDYEASFRGNESKGSATSGNGSIGLDKQCFFAGRASITAQYAKRIDNYFTMFGYSIGEIYHVTNADDPRDHRPYYTYMKTVGCQVGGLIPADDAKAIEELYDKGIRWWKYQNGMKVGDYSVDNSPVTT